MYYYTMRGVLLIALALWAITAFTESTPVNYKAPHVEVGEASVVWRE